MVAQMVRRLPAMRETQVRSLGQEDLLEKGMATHSSTLAWKILCTEEPGGYSPWGRKESDMTERLHFNQINEPLSASPISYLRTGGIVSSSIFPDLPSSPISQHLLIKNQEYQWMMTYHSLSPGKIAIVIVQSLSRVQLSVTPWTAAGCKVSLPSLSLRVCSNSCPLSWWYHPTISSPAAHFSSFPQSFPVLGMCNQVRLGIVKGDSSSPCILRTYVLIQQSKLEKNKWKFKNIRSIHPLPALLWPVF